MAASTPIAEGPDKIEHSQRRCTCLVMRTLVLVLTSLSADVGGRPSSAAAASTAITERAYEQGGLLVTAPPGAQTSWRPGRTPIPI